MLDAIYSAIYIILKSLRNNLVLYTDWYYDDFKCMIYNTIQYNTIHIRKGVMYMLK